MDQAIGHWPARQTPLIAQIHWLLIGIKHNDNKNPDRTNGYKKS